MQVKKRKKLVYCEVGWAFRLSWALGDLSSLVGGLKGACPRCSVKGQPHRLMDGDDGFGSEAARSVHDGPHAQTWHVDTGFGSDLFVQMIGSLTSKPLATLSALCTKFAWPLA